MFRSDTLRYCIIGTERLMKKKLNETKRQRPIRLVTLVALLVA